LSLANGARELGHQIVGRARGGALGRCQRRIALGKVGPRTANGWLSILRVILTTAVNDHNLERDPTMHVRDFGTEEHPTYTDEDPNSLATPELTQAFLAAFRKRYPHYYAMVLLGFLTGLRASSLRPLRRRGPSADVLWSEATILVRRSNALGAEIMNTTKTGKTYRLGMPVAVMDALRAHVAALEAGWLHETIEARVIRTLTETGPLASSPLAASLGVSKPVLAQTLLALKRDGIIEQAWKGQPWSPTGKERPNPLAESELLFPTTLRTGEVGMVARSALDKPFRIVSESMGLPFLLTPRGMRRTFGDLARGAGVSKDLRKAIRGHATDEMDDLYQRIQPAEMAAAVGAIASALRVA
jgi:integrase